MDTPTKSTHLCQRVIKSGYRQGYVCLAPVTHNRMCKYHYRIWSHIDNNMWKVTNGNRLAYSPRIN